MLYRGPLVTAHRTGARVGEQVDQHVLSVHLEQVVAGRGNGRLSLLRCGHPQRLDDGVVDRCTHVHDDAPGAPCCEGPVPLGSGPVPSVNVGQLWPLTSMFRAEDWRAKTRIGAAVGPSIAVSTMVRYALSCGP